jgi:hypothetical protein
MDADLLPLCSHLDALVLDYSTESVVLAWKLGPATGGLFVVTPFKNGLPTPKSRSPSTAIGMNSWGGDTNGQEVHRRRMLGRVFRNGLVGLLSIPTSITPFLMERAGINWRGAYADQGLLYRFAKDYHPSSEEEGVSSSVSMIHFDHVEESRHGTLRPPSHPPVHATRTCQAGTSLSHSGRPSL